MNNIDNIKKRLNLNMILLAVVLICGFIVMQSCGGDSGGDTATTAQTDSETITTAEEVTTTEPTTEPPTTTEKPPIKTEEILKWTFSEDNMIFKSGNQITDLKVEDGILKFTSTGGDPFLYTIETNLGIEASDVDYIKLRVRNLSEGYNNQLFFITNDSTNWEEPKSLKSDYWYADGEEWEELIYYTSDSDLWEGTIKQIRFDPITLEGGFEIEYVLFEKIIKE